MRTRLLALLVLVTLVAGSLAAAGQMSYIYKHGNTTYMRTDGKSLSELKQAGKKYGNEFIWVEKNGRSWVITDPGVLTSVRAVFGEMEVEAKPLQAMEKRLRPFEKQMEAVERRMDALSDKLDDEGLSEFERRALEARVRETEEQVRAVEEQMREVEKQMAQLERSLEKREKVIERRFEQIVERAISDGKADRAD